MDLVTVALQQSRVPALMSLQHKAVSYLISRDEEEDDVKKKRLRSILLHIQCIKFGMPSKLFRNDNF